ncbi:hypothetical protein [Marinomonas posidonica]|uniref:hypothetical protein n=1 Tax=Marinomonas posidonica TaxID=936476 RepID=UPI003735F5A0
MNIYNYHPTTKEYLGKTVLNDSDKNPLVDGEYLIPANAITQWPTVKAGANQAVIFNGSGWSLIDDFRGVQYWDENGEQYQIESIGERVPEGASLTEPVPIEEHISELEQDTAEEDSTEEVPE